MHKATKAYQEGEKANENGEPRSACPYKLGAAMYRNTERECDDWLAGWDAQQEVRNQWEADNHSRAKGQSSVD